MGFMVVCIINGTVFKLHINTSRLLVDKENFMSSVFIQHVITLKWLDYPHMILVAKYIRMNQLPLDDSPRT